MVVIKNGVGKKSVYFSLPTLFLCMRKVAVAYEYCQNQIPFEINLLISSSLGS